MVANQNFNSSMEEYTVLGVVGEGAHGIVLKAYRNVTMETVALKKVTLKKLSNEIPIALIREIKAVQNLDHPNIIKLINMFPQGLSLVLVFEYLPSNLWEILDSYRLTGGQSKCYMRMLLSGLSYMHSMKIMHRDLKPANLLIAKDGLLKIADFGLCRLISTEDNPLYSHQVATRWYRAPELLYGSRTYDESVDTWAAGVIFAEMIKGAPIFAGENDIDQLYQVVSSLGTPNEIIWPGCSQLPDFNKITFSEMDPVPLEDLVPSDLSDTSYYLSKFLVYDSHKRIRAQEALDDKYLTTTEPKPSLLSDLPPIPKPKRIDADSSATSLTNTFDRLTLKDETSAEASSSGESTSTLTDH